MRTVAVLAGLCVVAAAAGCAGSRQTARVSPGAVDEAGGAKFVCTGDACRLVTDERESRDAEAPRIRYTVELITCPKFEGRPLEAADAPGR